MTLSGAVVEMEKPVEGIVEPLTHPKRMIDAPDQGAYDAVIIGGGPAGITCGIYLMRKMINTLLISTELGGQVSWTADVENYPGYMEISGIDLAEKYKAQLEQFPIHIRLGDTVVSMEMRSNSGGVVRTGLGGEYAFRSLVIASGKRSRKLGVPGEDRFYGHGVTFCATCDGPLYRGETVAVIGGGNSALSAAIELLELGCDVYLINNRPDFQADEILVAKARRQPGFTTCMNHEVVRIEGDMSVNGIVIRDRGKKDERMLQVSGVFVEIGLIPNSGFAENIVAMNAHREIMVDCRCMTDVRSVFAAGDVTSVPNKQIIIAAGEGAKAALSVSRFLMNQA